MLSLSKESCRNKQYNTNTPTNISKPKNQRKELDGRYFNAIILSYEILQFIPT